jgi:hypothetical protein
VGRRYADHPEDDDGAVVLDHQDVADVLSGPEHVTELESPRLTLHVADAGAGVQPAREIVHDRHVRVRAEPRDDRCTNAVVGRTTDFQRQPAVCDLGVEHCDPLSEQSGPVLCADGLVHAVTLSRQAAFRRRVN